MAKKKFLNIKTTGDRPYNRDYIEYIENGLSKRGFDNNQIDIILGNIIEESGGNPFAKSEGGTYQGILQWAKNRYKISKEKDPYKEIDNQLDYLTESIANTTDKVSWTHGGEGSGYQSFKEPFSIFHNPQASIEDRHRAFSFGYVRPKGKQASSDNRLKVVNQVREHTYHPIVKLGTFIEPLRFNMGGIIPSRKKYDYGGISAPGYTSYGSVAKASDVDPSLTSADGEGIIGEQVMNYGTMGLGLGATVGGIGSAIAGGAAAGSVVPGLGTLIGAGVGALVGIIGGIFGGRKKKRREERRRAEAIAQQQEAGRQAIIGNMESKEESDVAQLRQTAMNTSETTSFYNKFGGMIPHRKLFGNGGQIIQNSSNTAMAYGPSHENGGIAYGENAEIEGGEAIRQTPIGDQIYSDKLFIPGTRRTFADDAQVLSEIKGMKEQEVQSRGSRILGKLEQLDRTRVNKLKMGTLMRNIEKDAFYMDKSAGQVVVLDKKLNDLFNTQEAVALVKGLRGNPQIARMGGCIRKKYPYGGIDMSDVLMEMPMAYNTSGATTTSNFNTKAFNNLNLTGLGINVLGTGLGMISNALSARTARKSLDWQMRNLTPAKRAKLIAPRYSTDYNINSDLQDIATQERRVAQYIKSNTSNPILARNLITKAAIDNLALRNKLYSQKRDYQTQRWDANINARIQTDNQNRQNDYLDQIDLRNHNMQYLGAIGNVQMQRAANFNAYLGDLATAGHQYLSARAYSTLWPTGVQRTMGTGLRCGGLVKGRRK